MNFHLYRVYSDDGELLYIGQTQDQYMRMGAHQHSAAWWTPGCRVRVGYGSFKTREQALKAERLAIAWECPKHNIQHSTALPVELRRAIRGATMPKRRAWNDRPRRVVVDLSEGDYAVLVQAAEADERGVSNMAAWLIRLAVRKPVAA